ncbi:MAG: iron-sulfur cluster assembly scaffold protein [Nitrospirae bacterium]|nr:iron-sulfur cluster assembly scaffold protein [Nitrospirota bacterium]
MADHDQEGFGETARDHADNPRNRGQLDKFNCHSRVTGPCGDVMEFWLYVQDDIIEKISFETDGCGSSLACGSMASVLAEGRKLDQAAAMDKREILDALGGLSPEMRHCALLAAVTLKTACMDYEGSRKTGAEIQNQIANELHESEEWRQVKDSMKVIRLGKLENRRGQG